ncbi:MAG: hypothetical protein ACPGWR_29830 [Ardenticatenaceae bacterium]
MGVQRSGFYYRLEQTLARLPQLFADGRQQNGRPPASIDTDIAGRIVELVVGQPGITPQAISQELAEQDKTIISVDQVVKYLKQAQLIQYNASAYREAILPTKEVVKEGFTRYAAQLLDIPQLEQLGLYRVLPLLDVTKPSGYYSNTLRWHTVLHSLSSGKSRLYHTSELVEDEFSRILGESRYPQRSDLHAYFDRIVAQDQQQAEEGIVEEERIIGHFVRQAQQQLAKAAPPGVGQAIYVDPHVTALHTKKPIARTKHGTQKRVVKALVRVQVVSANQPGRALAFKLGQADLSFRESLEETVDLTSWVTGEAVKLVGVDRGALSEAILKQFSKREIGLVVWSKDTPTMRQALALVAPDQFIDAEYETVRRDDGQQVERLKTRVADVPEMVINKEGYTCRTIVVEDVRNRKRIGIYAVGEPTLKMSAGELLSFMRGKQWVEEDIKQSIAWGGDAFWLNAELRGKWLWRAMLR